MTTASASDVRVRHFRDPRPPHAIRAELERDHMVLLAATMRDDRLLFAARSTINGAAYSIELAFETALDDTNSYVLSFEISWRDQTASAQDYHRRAAPAWLDLWLGRYPSVSPATNAVADARYHEIAASALAAEAHLTDAAAIQRQILDALRTGGRFSTSHKEGGTRIARHGDRFVRTDYGEHEATHVYASEFELLTGLRQFYDWRISRGSHPDRIDEFSIWKLILRQLEPAAPPPR